MTPEPPLLSVDGVSKRFVDTNGQAVDALQAITLSVRRSEFVTLVGPSGCGKTTLLRLIAGLETPSAGEILFEQQSVVAPSPERGMVFQAYTAFPWLTVRDNIAFGLRGPDDGSREARLAEWLDRTGLRDFAGSYPKALSGGMRQRLALARTMIVEPKLLLMDEPLGALDQRTREKMQAFLLGVVADTHCTAMLVTHDIREAVLLGDRICVMSARPGRLIEVIDSNLPKPRTIGQLATPQFQALYKRIVRLLPE
jgi:ABC-type nitrate/sulfonate/bicarbonate transport system ATPase subunit